MLIELEVYDSFDDYWNDVNDFNDCLKRCNRNCLKRANCNCLKRGNCNCLEKDNC